MKLENHLNIENKAIAMNKELRHLFPDVQKAELKVTPEHGQYVLKLKILLKGQLIIVTEVSEKVLKGMDRLYKKVLKVLRKKQAKTKSFYLKMA